MTDSNPLELISQVDEFMTLHEFIQDDDLDEALGLIVKLMANPNIPDAKVRPTIVKIEAYAAKFAILATVYSTIKRDKAGTDSNMKKNIFYTLAQSLTDLAAAVKYLAKV